MKKYLLAPTLFFIIDRVIKFYAPSINFEGGFVKFGFYKNYAGAFSLPIAGSLYNIVGVILLIIFLFLCLAERKKNYTKFIAYELVLFGGISNMADRFALGYTIDYINFMNFSFFNLADGMLLAGIIILIIENLKIKNSLKIEN